MATMNIGRSARNGSESGITGSEAVSMELPQSPDQAISASTEEEVSVSFDAANLKTFSMVCDQAVPVQLLETRYAITSSTVGPPGTITPTDADLTDVIGVGDLIRVENTVADDGVYLVATVTTGPSLITLENGQALPAIGGAVGTLSRVASKHISGYSYEIQSTTQATGTIVIKGNVSNLFAAGEYLNIQGTVGQDGYWEIDSVTWTTPSTIIIVNLIPGGAVGLPGVDELVVGYITKVSASIALAANNPFLWSIDGGLQNPFIHASGVGDIGPSYIPAASAVGAGRRGEIIAAMIDNTANAIAASFDARIGSDSDIFAIV